ncbi:hypothetical protein QN277_005887 [Acacia crassicarpa]|uniref:AAA+ ATPase domain-containing protein n=1 Tax=Acacia crassicarpa TaxID=499986 RepID=A0AAE1MC10_9FABA|nr:hypothetical protein QN277_005887 [Acacia crassicarpa]
MDPTCGLVDKFRDLLLNLTWEHLRYLIYYHRNIDQLNGQLKDLTLERSSLQHQIDEAENNGEKIFEKVLHWLAEVDELSEQVQKFHEESQAKAECNITSCPNPWLRYKLSKRAKEITEEVTKMYAKRSFVRISYPVPLPSMVELNNREGNEEIDSRVPIMNQILEEFRIPGVNMIGLCGIGGIGKTTIAKEVAKNQTIFEKVIMATVSQELNIEKIQGQIAEKLSMQLSENDKDVRAFRLCERLKQEKNMLLILDDLWEELDLGKVGIPCFNVESCKILLTSRDKSLLSNLMECQKIVEVGALSKDEALELFKKIAKLSTDSSSPELISITTDIVQKCGGLPLAIATAAKALRNKDINAWKDALVRLNNPFRRNNTLTREVDTILKWSFDCLSSLEYKKFFLLATMLSHDPSIEHLLMYSVGLDILDGIENMEDARVGVSTIVSKLKSLNLFLDSISSHHVTIHDVFRDVALPIASNEFHAFIRRRLKEWPDANMLQGYEGICLQESDISDLPEELHCPRLQFFFLNSTKRDLNIPSMFFKSSKELKVLVVTNVHFSSLLFLIFLHKLKAMCLHFCLLEDIAEVRSLKNLKVLSLAYSEIQRLPIELAELTSLQMLNLSHCYNLKVLPQKLLSSLKKLEVLYLGNSFHQWKVEGDSEANENASLDELIDLPLSSLEIHISNIFMLPENFFLDLNLKRYNISIGKKFSYWEWHHNYKTLKILKLQLQSGIHLKGGVQKLFEGVEDLYLDGSNALENVLFSHEGRGFPHLRHLQIDGYGIRSNKTFKSLFNSKVQLPKLEILELSHLWNRLTPLIWDDQLSRNSFNNLKVLVVKKCGFVKLVPLHVLKSLNNLEKLDMKDCDMLEIVFDFEDLNDYYKKMDSSLVVVPLKKLKLQNLPKLKNVWSNNYQGNVSFPSLRSIDVDNCESLTSMFPTSIAKGMLCDLEELQICQCGVDVIVAKDQVSESVAVTFEFPRLTSLLLSSLPNLRNFYSQKHTLELSHLNQLSIKCCDELDIFEKEVLDSSEIYEEEKMPDSKYPLLPHDKVIGNLERLRLKGKQVEKIGSGQFLMYHFPKLKQLHLSLETEPPPVTYRQLWQGSSNLGGLKLSGDFEKTLGGDNVAALAALFPKLTLKKISIMRSLSTSLVSSPNLTHLNVKECKGTTLMTSSIARSLVHLMHLSVSHCDKIEEIITKQEGEDDEDREIFFNQMKFLELGDLARLKRFCGYNYTFKFLLLDQLIIKRCPKFKIFSPGLIETPSLKSVQLWEDWSKYHEIWDTDLKKTFYRQRYVSPRKLVLGEDDAIMIRNDQFPGDCCPKVEILQIEGFLEKWVTFPYTLLERFPKLNELHLKSSSFEEIFPSHAPSSTSFHNLTVLKVSKCHQFVYILTTSTTKSLVNLETLEIDDCAKLEEIVRNDIDEDVEGEITFNGLRILKLTDLPRLKTQEDKRDFYIEDRATNTRCTNIPRSLFSHDKGLLPKLEILELSYLRNNLISLIWDDQLSHNSFNNLKTLILGGCGFMKTVPLRLLKSLNNLEKLEVISCYNLEMVFGFEDLNDSHKELESSSMVVPLSLTHLEVKCCHGLTTLMTSSIARSLVHLMHLSISYCDQIEEIITKQEGEDDEDREIIFSQMKFLELGDLKRLKRFCGYNYTFKFLLLDQLIIKECPKFEIFSPGIIETPSLKSVQLWKDWNNHHEFWDTDLNKTLSRQRYVTSRELVLDEDDTIMIRNDQFPVDCCPQVEILQIAGFVEEWVTFPYTLLERFPKLNELHVKNSSFEEIFPSHTPSFTSFYNLTVLKVSECHQLVYLVTTSTTESLVNLETLEIDDCKNLEEIVRNDSDQDVEGGITFNGLRILKLTHLPRLKTQEDQRDFNIEDRATNTRCTNIPISLFNHNKVIGNLERLTWQGKEVEKIGSGQFLMYHFPKLKQLHLSLEKEPSFSDLTFWERSPNLRELKLSGDLEKALGGDNIAALAGCFPKLTLENISILGSLSPSLVSSPNLTHLKVSLLYKWTTLMTSSIARSLIHLTHLSIIQCYQMEEIITKQEGEDDEDREIFFNKMKFLKLDGLPRLRRFCRHNCTFRFPLLEHVIITECPQLTIFCPGAIHAPQLQSVEVNEFDPYKDIWMTDLNNTIQHLLTFREVISTCSSMVLNSKNITMIKNVFPNVSFLYVESFMDEGVTFPYNSLEKFPKLDWLNVEHCSFEEIFPSQDQIIDFMWKIPPFEGLYIAYMDKLKSIWKDDSQLPPIHQNLTCLEVESCCSLVQLAPSCASFQNLGQLYVSRCHQLIHLVTTSTAKSFVSLRWLKINDCKRMEEIVMNDANENVQVGITFNRLYSIKLTDMPSLKMFSSQSHTFEFPKLEEIVISGCPEMKLFCPGVLKTLKLSKVKIEEHDMEWKDEEDVNKIMEGIFSAKDSINL